MSEISVPIHDDAGRTENREAESQQEPYYFETKSPERSEVQGMHGPHEPVTDRVILAIVPNAEHPRVGAVDCHNVAMREIAWRAEIHLRVD